MLRCRAGDLAFCLKGGSIGLMVEVLKYHGGYVSQNGVYYPHVWMVRVSGQERNHDGTFFAEDDSNLLPIRPAELKETEETKTNAE